MTAPYTPAQRRRRRLVRLIERATSELNRLNWERREIQDDYKKAAEIYARKLERLGARAARNTEAMKALADFTARKVDELS